MLPERILVTGASGFIGSEIVRQAVTMGYHVRAMSRARTVPGEAHEHIVADVRDAAAMRNAVAGIDLVIHSAGLAHVRTRGRHLSADLADINEIGTLNVARAAVSAGVRRFVHVSSVSVYGIGRHMRSEVSVCHPDGHYAVSKWRSEQVVADTAASSAMSLTILRLATVYGEEDPGNILRVIRAIDRGRFVWIGNGQNRKTLIYRGDAARACIIAGQEAGLSPRLFNVTAPSITMAELVAAVVASLNKQVSRIRIPAVVGRASVALGRALAFGNPTVIGMANSIDRWLSNDEYDGARFEAAFGFRAQVDLTEGVAREVAWYRRGVTDGHAIPSRATA